MSSTTNLCDACHTQPKFVDGTKTHSFCSKTCANTMCEHCHQRPKFKDGSKTHPYCGKRCAGLAKTAEETSSKSANGSCLICGKPSTRGPFCSKTCSSKAESNAPSLLEVPKGHGIFDSIESQFKTSWRHPTTRPTVARVYKVVESPTSVANYENYKATVEAKGGFVASGLSAGNEKRRWHGTTRECLLGDNGNTTLCSSGSCPLCGIIRTSYRLDLFGKKTGWGRFGKGIYTSSTSSKSNDYTTNLKSSNQKAMLLNKVVVGKGYKMTQNDTSRTAPPTGFDSVLGEVVGGGCLNYDELVCYTENAIRPSYLVVYST